MIHDRPAVLAPPDLSAGAGPVVLIENGLVVPPAKGLGNQSAQRSGVLRPDGGLVAESVTWRGASQVTIGPALRPLRARPRGEPRPHLGAGPDRESDRRCGLRAEVPEPARPRPRHLPAAAGGTSAADEDRDIVANAVESLDLWFEDQPMVEPRGIDEVRTAVADDLRQGAFLIAIPYGRAVEAA